MPSTRSPPCNPSTPCGPATRRTRCCRSCESWVSDSFRTPRWATASSPEGIRSTDNFADDDWRKTNPRFTGENFQRNLRLADQVEAVAAEVCATPAQVALAWLLAKGDGIVPIPGIKRVSRLEENVAADGVHLSAEQMDTLDNLTPAAGGHHNEEQMRLLER